MIDLAADASLQVAAAHSLNGNSSLMCQVEYLTDCASLLDTCRQQDGEHPAPPGPQRLADRLPAIKDLTHEPTDQPFSRQRVPSGPSSRTMPRAAS